MWFNKAPVSDTTLEHYRGQLPRILQAIGKTRIDKLNEHDITIFINGLSSGVVENNLGIISNVCKLGKSLGMITVNPAENIKPQKKPRKEKKIYSREEMRELLSLLETCDNPQLRLFANLAAYTGMRTAEILALEWVDINFEACTLYIHQQLLETKEKGLYIAPYTKNRIPRTITVEKTVIDLLADWKQKQGDECKAGMVFGENGGFMSRYTPRNELMSFCNKHGLNYRSPHTFRHFVGSMLIAQGENPATVAAYIGDKISTVLDYYVHAEEEAVKKASKTIGNVIQNVKNGDK